MTIQYRVAELQATINKTKKNSPLSAQRPHLLAASKGQGLPQIEEAVAAGVEWFGENRVQEAWEKWPELKKRHPNIKLHLIGPLQTNKVREALGLFDVIQTLDREKLAVEIAKTANSQHPVTNSYFIQVNTGEEPQKAGIAPKEADAFIRYCQDELALPVVGLMCIPPAGQPPAPHFALLRDIAWRNGLKELSMGMSGDFETAIRMGSSCVRIGTALFGERPNT